MSKMKALILTLSVLYTSSLISSVDYTFSDEPIDVVIPCTDKDLSTLPRCLEGIKKHGKNIRRIIIVSKEKLTDDAEWFSEDRYPFSKEDLAKVILGDTPRALEYMKSSRNRSGWLIQQLIKLYAVYVIPGISSNVLVLDADTMFLKEVDFQDPLTHAGLFNVGREHHQPYFAHGKRLIPGFKKHMKQLSGICHWMLLQKPLVDNLFHTVEKEHQTSFWKAFCQCIDHEELYGSSASEYEIYFNFSKMTSKHFALKPLKWKNVESFKEIETAKNEGYDYVSYHSYTRE